MRTFWTTTPKQLRLRILPLLGLILAGSFLIGCQPAATEPEPPVVCQPVCVGEHFARFYETIEPREAEMMFGRPRSGEIILNPDTPEERLVQFFDNVRLDFDPRSGKVEVADLGRWAYEGRITDDIPPESDIFEIEGAFKAFYETDNRAELIGPPLSPVLEEGGHKVQYFRNVRLEWHPGAPSGRQVVVSLLGRAQYIQEFNEPRLIAQPVDVEQAQLNTLIIEAGVTAPILYAGDQQTVHITALTAERQPVENVRFNLTVWQGTEALKLDVPVTTDTRGRVEVPLDLPDVSPGEEIIVEISISAYWLNDAPLGSTTVAFETWW